jgi:hypothetical protein
MHRCTITPQQTVYISASNAQMAHKPIHALCNTYVNNKLTKFNKSTMHTNCYISYVLIINLLSTYNILIIYLFMYL